MPRIIEELKKKGVAAERKSVYDDIRLLQEEYGLPIEHEEGARTYRLAEHSFEFHIFSPSVFSDKTILPRERRSRKEKK